MTETSNYMIITFMYLIYAPKEVYSGGKNLFLYVTSLIICPMNVFLLYIYFLGT